MTQITELSPCVTIVFVEHIGVSTKPSQGLSSIHDREDAVTAVSRRCLLVVAAASTVASTSSCAKIKNLAKNIGSNPTVQELIGEIAKEVGANVVG